MGDIHMESAEDILAEPDEPTLSIIGLITGFLHAYGWYIIAAVIAIYAYYKNRIASKPPSSSASATPKSPAEMQQWQSKEEQRLKAVQRLQERYAVDSAVRAEKQEKLDEAKRKARLEEMEKLAGKVDLGRKVGEDEKSKRFKPEYNPLNPGESGGSSGRVCFRRPGGGQGG